MSEYNDVMKIGTGGPTPAESRFRATLDSVGLALGSAGAPLRVIELGCRRWFPDFPTHHAAWAPLSCEWIKSDITGGTDVDVAADAHDLVGTLDGFGGVSNWAASLDAYVAVSVFEHLRRPWEAARSAAAVLRPGGLAYVATHQTFPLHGFPHDYFRFSDLALRGIFEDAGFEVLECGYSYPCQIVPPADVTRWNPGADAYMIVDMLARLPEG